jgi:hypothetical protein
VTLIVSGGIGIVQFLAVLPTILYIDQWGKPCPIEDYKLLIVDLGRKPLLRGAL